MVLQLDTEVVGAPAVGSSLAESCGLVLRREGVFSQGSRVLEPAVHSYLGLSQNQPVLHATGSPYLQADPARHTQRSWEESGFESGCLSVKSGI